LSRNKANPEGDMQRPSQNTVSASQTSEAQKTTKRGTPGTVKAKTLEYSSVFGQSIPKYKKQRHSERC